MLGLAPSDLIDVPPQRLSAGNPTLFIAVRTREAVDRAWLDLAGMRQLRGSAPELAWGSLMHSYNHPRECQMQRKVLVSPRPTVA